MPEKAKRGFASIYLLCGQSKFDMRFALDMHTLRCVDMPCKQGVIFLRPMVHRQSPTEFSVSPFGDKTRAELRFAKIHSKANRKPDFCYSESLASTLLVDTACQHIELRSNISSAKHISNLLCLQSKYIDAKLCFASVLRYTAKAQPNFRYRPRRQNAR